MALQELLVMIANDRAREARELVAILLLMALWKMVIVLLVLR